MREATKAISSSYFTGLRDLLSVGSSTSDLFQSIVDAPFKDKLSATDIDLGIVVLLLVNKKTNMIDRVALSDTDLARQAVNMSAKPFKSIKIPLGHEGNSVAKAISTGEVQKVSDWQYLFAPSLTPQEARLNQAGSGIECSFIYPLKDVQDGGALIFSFYQPPQNVGDQHDVFVKEYGSIVCDALNSLKKDR